MTTTVYPQALAAYDELTVQKGLNIIRIRPGQFVGDFLNNEYSSAPMNLVREIVGNSTDEYVGGHATTVKVFLDQRTNQITVADDGRGIPFSWNEKEGMSNLEISCAVMYGGAKYDKGDGKAFKFSIGMNGIGLTCCNALSSHFKITSTRDGETASMVYSKGEKVEDFAKFKDPKGKRGTSVSWVIDQSILPFQYNPDYLRRYLHEAAYLNAGVRIELILTDADGQETTVVYHEPNGIFDLRDDLVESRTVLAQFPPLEGKDPAGNEYQIALSILEDHAEEYHPFVNGSAIEVASTPVVSVRQCLAKAILQYMTEQYVMSKKQQKLEVRPEDVRSGVCCVIKLLHQDPAFHAQTKTKLINNDIATFINQDLKDKLLAFLLTNPSVANKVVDQVLSMVEAKDAAEKARQAALKARQQTRKPAEELNISLDVYTPPLADDPANNRLYFFEGLSAANALIDAFKETDPETGKMYKENVGILALKGIGLNPLEKDLRQALQNTELSTLVKVAGLSRTDPSDLSGLNFNRFIIATDSDAGGAHICILLLTFFVRHYPEVIKQGLLYRVHTPFYEITDIKTKRTHFIYPEESVVEKLAEFGYRPEDINKTFLQKRNKGLGELGEQARMTLVQNPRLKSFQYDDIPKMLAMLHLFSGSDYVASRREVIFEHGLTTA